MSRATWYVLEDGSAGDPLDILPGDDGKLTHKDGRAVAYAPHGPRSRSVDPEAERTKSKAAKPAPFGGKGDHDGDGKAGGSVPTAKADGKPEAKPDTKPEAKDMKPEGQKRGYQTRESKAD